MSFMDSFFDGWEHGMSNSSSSSGGIGLCGCVFIVFLILKLLGHIAWSWWWVTAPLWMPFGLVIGIGLIVIFVALVIKIITS